MTYPAARRPAHFLKKCALFVTANARDVYREVMGTPTFESMEYDFMIEQVEVMERLYVGGAHVMTADKLAVHLKKACLEIEAPDNVLTALPLDVAGHPWPVKGVDGVFSANTLHIISWGHVGHFFRGVGEVLFPGGTLCVYGPFRYGGKFTTPSNAEFDAWLKRRDPASGVRDLDAVDQLAREQGLVLVADHPMPANNQTLVWRRSRAA